MPRAAACCVAWPPWPSGVPAAGWTQACEQRLVPAGTQQAKSQDYGQQLPACHSWPWQQVSKPNKGAQRTTWRLALETCRAVVRAQSKVVVLHGARTALHTYSPSSSGCVVHDNLCFSVVAYLDRNVAGFLRLWQPHLATCRALPTGFQRLLIGQALLQTPIQVVVERLPRAAVRALQRRASAGHCTGGPGRFCRQALRV